MPTGGVHARPPWGLVLAAGLFLAACTSPENRAPSTPTPTRSPLPTAEAGSTPTGTPVGSTEQTARELLAASVVAMDEGASDRSLALVIAAVAAAPDGTATEQAARFLLGSRLLAQGAASSALIHLEAARANPGPLLPYVIAALADARASSGELEVARRLRADLLSDPATPPSVRDAVIAAAAPSATPEDAETLAFQANRPEALAAALRAMAAGGSDQALGRAIERLLERFPASKEALEAIRLAAEVGADVDPGLVGRALYRNGRLDDAIAVLTPAAADPQATSSSLVLRTYYLAAAIDDSGRWLESVALYDVVRTLDPADPLAYRASYWAARALEHEGRTAEATDRYVVLVAANPAGQFAGEAAFRAGFAWFEAGDAGRAIAVWEMAAAGADARVLYWKGRALEADGRPEEALAAFTAAAADRPGFYGEEAQHRLDGTRATMPDYRDRPERPAADWAAAAAWFASRTGLAPPQWEAVTAAGALASLGLRDEARAAVESAAAATDDHRAVFILMREAHDALLSRTAIALLERVLADFPTPYADLPQALQQVLYPLPFPGPLIEQARTYDLDPLFLAALVRQESHWDPTAISIAGAVGLTQVMPTTGTQIAEALGSPAFTVADLFRPPTSLKFGAYYISAQLRRFASPVAALAAYNGGPGNAARWAAFADPADDPARYLEAITFQETHGYVEFVLTGYSRYRALAVR